MGDVHDPDQALQLLLGGNQRWASGQAVHPNQSRDRRVEVAGGQHPIAVIFSCVDSRVPPELVFDQGLGDLLVIRTAAHVLDNAALGSIEFGVEELHIPLIMVLGHERCGAVTASVDAVTQNAHAPGQIEAVVEGIRPAVVQTSAQAGDRVDNTVRAHVALTVERLRQTGPILTEVQEHGALKVVGGRYDLDTGLVELLA
jgi:carbonic anhydrase